MTANTQVTLLLTWIAENLEAEPLSGILPGGPVWNVSAYPLLDKIAELWGWSRAEVGSIVNTVRERVEAENDTI